MGNIESGAKKEGDLTLGIAPTIRVFDKGLSNPHYVPTIAREGGGGA